MLPLQHPVGHDAALQMHWPVVVLQTWPFPHAAQVTPKAPQEELFSEAYASHVPAVPPLQQPPGQVFESHEQVPLVLSQRPFVQLPQAAPPTPHCVLDCEAYGTQVLPLQQPFGHEVASHTHPEELLEHSSLVEQAPHTAPATPHDALVCEAYATHVPPTVAVQHPLGHDVASHTHWPVVLLHSCPEPHAPHAAPPAPHEVFVSDDGASHVEPLQQPVHAPPPPHEQTPLAQVSPLPQGLHAAPDVPQWLVDWDA